MDRDHSIPPAQPASDAVEPKSAVAHGLGDESRGEFEGERVSASCAVFPHGGPRAVLTLSSAPRSTVQASLVMPLRDLIGIRDAISAAIGAATAP
jgi:hypothetical protein